MTYLALDKSTGDLILQDGGGVARVDGGRFVVQQVQSKLLTALGEWLLDPTIGWMGREDFDRNYDQFDIESRARKIILQTQGVLEVDFLTSSYSQRKLTIQFEARTTYGSISLTIPWE
jgi:hypothetical protein